MARKNYSDEFRRQAVDLYESTPGATVRGIAEDLGVERGTLRLWLTRLGTGKKIAADGSPTVSPLKPAGAGPSAPGVAEQETLEQRVVRPTSSQQHARCGTGAVSGRGFPRRPSDLRWCA